MVTMDQFTGKDGRIDWAGYSKAQIDQGENCRQCGHFILDIWRKWTGGPRLCCECADIAKPPEARHHRYARCPACRHLFAPDFDLAVGDHKQRVECPGCDFEFRIGVECRFVFTSPAVEEKPAVAAEEHMGGRY